MSATRDKDQKTTFMYSNLYALYRKGKVAAQNATTDAPVEQSLPGSGKVIKAGDLKDPTFVVSNYRPTEFLSKRIRTPELLRAQEVKPQPHSLQAVQNEALGSLKDNLKNLNELHSRLRFMLKELEDLVKE